MAKQHRDIDEVGAWSEIKLEILKKYAVAYSTILASKTSPNFSHFYIEGFAGAGEHISRTTGEMILGSPRNALLVSPPFLEYHLIDLSEDRIKGLEKAIGDQPNVFLYHGDCNKFS